MIQSSKELLLALLQAPNRDGHRHAGIVGITKVEKLAFLSQRFTALESIFDVMRFKPDNFGPFSEVVQDDLEYLRTLGLVKFAAVRGRPRYDDLAVDEESGGGPIRYELTEKGARIADKLVAQFTKDERRAIEEIKAKYNHLTVDQLLSHVYRTSEPHWTSQSVVADRYLV